MSRPPADPARARLAYAVLGASACLGGTGLLCVVATVIVAGSTSHLGASAAGQTMLALLGGELLAGLLALGLYAHGLHRRAVPWWGLWWLVVALVLLTGLALLAFATVVLFNR